MSFHHLNIESGPHSAKPAATASKFAASMVSHDIRNAMTTIDLLIESMRAGPTWMEQLGPHCIETLAQRAERASHRIATLCGSFLTDEQSECSATVDDVLADIVAVSPLHPNVSLRLATDPDCGIEMIAHDQDVFRVIMNLVTNATNATALNGGGQISIETSRDGDTLRIDICDEGGGFNCQSFPKADRNGGPIIVDPYRKTSLEQKGHGLGIMIAMTIATRIGGSLQVIANDVRGAKIRFSIPLSEGRDET